MISTGAGQNGERKASQKRDQDWKSQKNTKGLLMRFFQNKEGEGQMCRIYSSHPSRTLSIDFFVFFVAIMSMFRALESDTSSLH